eukprot:Gregarina_sp_Poly_1__4801@NODE_255_length_10547_cov_146_368416_g222_i0_p1_GENE_NODE_255_length_10547_cov_146_368416_g222_i0NODE_255_length_10547_cov_146_368416_g222_i0_p1_ORF_typecomplete_len1269_score134_45PGAP1/PF07819_13/7_3e12PGAP1/PF07819_13/8e03DUF676/PF05057_14/8_4e05Abhydrolase_2/PF02230_16/0_0013Abhydrolase_2/PF02230_16/6_3e03Abhydrolase_6/PF12697_7/0_038Abhydrolase_6/PF12697_7/3_6e03Hydrolase_4/PF12146_8/1_6e03Hydrolase_4/PF12146_8/0_079UPF0227/PF05728_12/0_16UPF0227/PF05728_12/2e03LID
MSQAGPVYHFEFENQYSATSLTVFLDQVTTVRETLKTIASYQWSSGDSQRRRRSIVLGGFSMGGVIVQYVLAQYLKDAVSFGCEFEPSMLRRPQNCNSDFYEKWPLDIGLVVTLSSPVRDYPYPRGLAWNALYKLTLQSINEALKQVAIDWKRAFPLFLSFCGGQSDILVACSLTNLKNSLVEPLAALHFPPLDTLTMASFSLIEGHHSVVRNKYFLHSIVAPYILYYGRLIEQADDSNIKSAYFLSSDDAQQMIMSSMFLLFQYDTASPVGRHDDSSNLAHFIAQLTVCNSNDPDVFISTLLEMANRMIGDQPPDMTRMFPQVMESLIAGLRTTYDNILSSTNWTAYTQKSDDWTNTVRPSFQPPESKSTTPKSIIPKSTTPSQPTAYERQECYGELEGSDIATYADTSAHEIIQLYPETPVSVYLSNPKASPTTVSIEMLLESSTATVAAYWKSGNRISKRIDTSSFPIRHHQQNGQIKELSFHFALAEVVLDSTQRSHSGVLLNTLSNTKCRVVLRELAPSTTLLTAWPSRRIPAWHRRTMRDFIAHSRLSITASGIPVTNTSTGLMEEAQSATDFLILISESGRLLTPQRAVCHWQNFVNHVIRECQYLFRPRHQGLLAESWHLVTVNADAAVSPFLDPNIVQDPVVVTSLQGHTYWGRQIAAFGAAHGLTLLTFCTSYWLYLLGYHLIIQGVAKNRFLYHVMEQIRFVDGLRFLTSIGTILQMFPVIFIPSWGQKTEASGTVFLKRRLGPATLFNFLWLLFIMILATIPSRNESQTLDAEGDIFDDLSWVVVAAIIWGLAFVVLLAECLVLTVATSCFLVWRKYDIFCCTPKVDTWRQVKRRSILAKGIRLVYILAIATFCIIAPSFVPPATLFGAAYLFIRSVLHIPVRDVSSFSLASLPNYLGSPVQAALEQPHASDEDRHLEMGRRFYTLRSAFYLILQTLLLYQSFFSIYYIISQMQEMFSFDKNFLFVGGYRTSLDLVLRSDAPRNAHYFVSLIFDLYLAPLIPIALVFLLLKKFNRRCGFVHSSNLREESHRSSVACSQSVAPDQALDTRWSPGFTHPQTSPLSCAAQRGANASEETTFASITFEHFRQRRQRSLEIFLLPNQFVARRDAIVSVVSGGAIMTLGFAFPLVNRLSSIPFDVFPILIAAFICICGEGFLMLQHQFRKQPFVL